MKNIKTKKATKETKLMGTINKPIYELKYTEGLKIKVSIGNIKIGKIYNFNLLPGHNYLQNNTRGILTNIHGTCTGCCEGCENGGCYAIKSARRYHNTCIPSWGINTLMAYSNLPELFRQLEATIVKSKIKVLRFHSAGEIPSYEYLLKMVELAKTHQSVTFYCYTKRFNWIAKYLSTDTFPENFVINISKWHNNIDGYNFEGLNIFAYDDGTEPELKDWVHCPAVNKYGKETGVTCDKCGRCYRNNGTKTAVYAH